MPGGRDIHFEEYSAQNKGTVLCSEAKKRFRFTAACMDALPKTVPVLGICYGCQFLNVYFGGSLVQDLPDKHRHYKDNWIRLRRDSRVRSAVGQERVYGKCFHHQGLGNWMARPRDSKTKSATS